MRYPRFSISSFANAGKSRSSRPRPSRSTGPHFKRSAGPSRSTRPAIQIAPSFSSSSSRCPNAVSCNTHVKAINSFLAWLHAEGTSPSRFPRNNNGRNVACARPERRRIAPSRSLQAAQRDTLAGLRAGLHLDRHRRPYRRGAWASGRPTSISTICSSRCSAIREAGMTAFRHRNPTSFFFG